MHSPLHRRQAPDFPSIIAACIGIGAFGLALGLTYPLLSILLVEQDESLSIIGLNAASMGELGFDSLPYGFAICFAALFLAIVLSKGGAKSVR